MKRSSNITRAFSLWNMVFLLTMLVYAVGLFIDIMEPDAAVYAEISMEMHDSGNFLSIFHKHIDWLDKPPFPFWMSAISYKIFGVSTFAYKFPAVIFILLGALYTFLFGKRFYSPLHGWIAALILITAQHIIISNQDVRAEPFMTGLVIMALYHFAMYLENRKTQNWPHAVFGAFALACLMMTKGLFTIIPVGAGIGLSLLYKKNWKAILDWRWLIIGMVMILFLFPAIYGYYLQFDMHPEKEIFGKHGVSGVEFFLWTSQWGRFTNTGPIKGSGDPFFFVHTMIWAFLPWSFAAFYGLFRKTKQLLRKTAGTETYTYFGFIALFLIFSASKFQLSFYLNPLFPLLSILTADALLRSGIRILKIFSTIHLFLCILLILALALLHYFFLNNIPHIDTLIILLVSCLVGFYIFSRKRMYLKKIFFATSLVLLSVNYYVNRDFYPALLDYQAESQVAHFMKKNNIPADQIVFVGDVQSVADIILHHVTPIVSLDSVKASDVQNRYVFTAPEGQKKIDSLGLKYTVVTTLEDFPVTRLTGKFINRNTRYKEVQTKFLLKTGPLELKPPTADVTIH
jgi:4-amino-4-deoxy-L-arabinose transferase-like glycosyltransferase